MNADRYKSFIKQKANELGFFYCGFSTAGFLADEAPKLERWLRDGLHGKMTYMENHFDKRLDPTKLVEGSNSVISLLLNYYPSESQTENAPKISKYAYGEDYHLVIKDKLKLLVESMKEEIGDIHGRVFVDSAPVMDKAWAKKAGLGWLGKNTNLIHPKEGSFFFIAEIISDLSFTQDPPMRDYCGTCSKCLDACPTNALATPYQIDASRCISYLTIELKDQLIPQQFNESMENWMFGCDICQDVCPWNRFSKAHQEKRFNPDFELLNLNTNDWQALNSDHFEILFKNSAIKRTGFQGLKRNINFLKPIEKP
jgi:epoxyqueuosine reductase